MVCIWGLQECQYLSSKLIRDKSKMSPPALKVEERNGKEDASKVTEKCKRLWFQENHAEKLQQMAFIVNFVAHILSMVLYSRRMFSQHLSGDSS